MFNERKNSLSRIAVFYDGNYFYHVSNYYCYGHPRRTRLSIPGIHEFIVKYIATCEGIAPKFCQIVDCHYFRGRLPAMEANERQILLNERIFDDILMREGIVTHYLPMTKSGEKGVDVSLALEALELAILKQYNVVVLIASDGDYVPLIRKLNSLGTRVMVCGWDFEYTDDQGNARYTSTSTRLMSEAAYAVKMHDIINGIQKVPGINPDMLFVTRDQENDPGENLISGTGSPNGNPAEYYIPSSTYQEDTRSARKQGRIVQLRSGYGFISSDTGKNIFFFIEELRNCAFDELAPGDLMEYDLGYNDRGECCKNVTLVKKNS
ncbi:MAG: NYN domain-containing protein [Lentisphaeria bacterium]|nr:NYN domain-containing protein [Lentisphaeria bacterium]